jgi:hypothetical protein
VELDRVRSDPGLAVLEVEEGDPGDTGTLADADGRDALDVVTRTVERKPKAHQWPLRVVDCPSCGWRHYPKPEQNGEPAVQWKTASTCSACGRSDLAAPKKSRD